MQIANYLKITQIVAFFFVRAIPLTKIFYNGNNRQFLFRTF